MLTLPYDSVPFYTPLIQDYLNGVLKEKQQVEFEYNWDTIALNLKQNNFPISKRLVLQEVLRDQYKGLTTLDKLSENLNALGEANCYTVTTGHQLVFAGGPMFFFTKIIECIQWAKIIQDKLAIRCVPVFWLASEDHDFEEIAGLNIFNHKLKWESTQKGAVGFFELSEVQELIQQLLTILGTHAHVEGVKTALLKAYTMQHDLAQATRILVHELLGETGIVVLDARDVRLKKLFLPIIAKEIQTKEWSKQWIDAQSVVLREYKQMVTPREINLFYLRHQYRERLDWDGEKIVTVDGKYQWENAQVFMEMALKETQNISPNVCLRPLYQECILPNLAYIGGAGEVAYWLQLTQVFASANLAYPLPIVRTSFAFLPQKNYQKLLDFHLDLADLWLRSDLLTNKLVEVNPTVLIDLNTEKAEIKQLFKQLHNKGIKISKDLAPVVFGEEKRALGVLENLEKRFRNADKKNREQEIKQLHQIQEKLFPNGVFQERYFSLFQLLTHYSWTEITQLIQSNIQAFDSSIRVQI